MDVVSYDWSNRHKELNKVIRKAEYSDEVIEIILDLHKELHTSKVSKSEDKNTIDTLFGDLQQNEFAIIPTTKDETLHGLFGILPG